MNVGPNGSPGDGRLDQLDAGRGIWVDVGWRFLQSFIAVLLVDVSGTDYIAALKTVAFWEDCVGAAIAAALGALLALASSRAGVPGPPRSSSS